MKKIFIPIFDYFLPRFCPVCKEKLFVNEKVVCPSCLSKIKLAEIDRINSEFERKFANNNFISGFISQYVFEKEKELQHIIHSLKYEKRFSTGIFLGENLAKNIGNFINNYSINSIVPIPLHPLKEAERGYNQAYYISKGLSKVLKIKLEKNAVKRIRFTESQTTMSLKEREENIRNAFTIKKRKNLLGKNILLVDDIITTGATIRECGRILKEAGANKIYAASVAIAD